jgi:hypothetical protein
MRGDVACRWCVLAGEIGHGGACVSFGPRLLGRPLLYAAGSLAR